MSRDDQIRWDRRYCLNQAPRPPAPFLLQVFEGWELSPGRALDIACGDGRNALFLAEQEFDVTAIDISPVALASGARQAREKSLSIDWQQADLENLTLQAASYDLILNIDYLQRSLIPTIKAAVKTGGFIIFETYLIDQKTVGYPKNPDYLLKHNELSDAFREFRVLFYREGRLISDGEVSFRAGIFAQKVR